jgi:hypothetical protein
MTTTRPGLVKIDSAAEKAMPAEVLDNLAGALMIGGCLVLQPLLRSCYRRWGATAEEAARPLPGDERTPQATVMQTMAVTVHAPAVAIWPWLAQIGQERGGLYSYELLENLARCQMRNADHVEPAWELQVGDAVRLGPAGYPVYAVVGMAHNKWLLLAAAEFETCRPVPPPEPGATAYVADSWVLYLDEQADGTTRLISRHRLEYAPQTVANKLMWDWTTEPIGSVMTHRMLLGIKERVERAR